MKWWKVFTRPAARRWVRLCPSVQVFWVKCHPQKSFCARTACPTWALGVCKVGRTRSSTGRSVHVSLSLLCVSVHLSLCLFLFLSLWAMVTVPVIYHGYFLIFRPKKMNYIVRFIYHTYIFGFFFTFFPGREREEVGGAVYALLLFFFFFWGGRSLFSLLLSVMCCFTLLYAPKGRPWMSDVSLCLESQGCHLIPLYCLLLVLLPSPVSLFVLSFFFCLLAHSPDFFPENSSLVFRWGIGFWSFFCCCLNPV